VINGQRISGFVITQNVQEVVRDCLESMKWVDELVVVDSHSDDATRRIAAEYTNRIIEHEFQGHVAQTRYAFEQTTGDWVLWLDSDERLTGAALDQIRSHLAGPERDEWDGLAFPRATYFLNRWIRHGGWYPQHKLRLMRRVCAQIVGTEPHPEAVVQGRVRKLSGDILHLSYPGGVSDYLQRSCRYADISARGRFAQGKRASWRALLCKPPLVFLKSYVARAGFLDGVPGLAVAMGSACYRFSRDLRLWELEHGRAPEPFEPPDVEPQPET